MFGLRYGLALKLAFVSSCRVTKSTDWGLGQSECSVGRPMKERAEQLRPSSYRSGTLSKLLLSAVWGEVLAVQTADV